MRASHKWIVLIMLGVVAIVAWDLQAQQQRGRQGGRAVRVAQQTELKAALDVALADEREAIARYQAMLAKFGDRGPIANLLQAERRHEAALLHHYQRLGLAVPDDARAAAAVELPATFAEACALSAAAERENGALFDRLLAEVNDEAVRATFINLRDASIERHLPALERWAQRDTQGGRGPGARPNGAGRGHRGGR